MMEMKKISSGKMRAIGYDAASRTLRVEFDDGRAVEHAPVGSEMWRRLSTSAAAWSYYRDEIEEEIPGHRAGKPSAAPSRNPLDDLFN